MASSPTLTGTLVTPSDRGRTEPRNILHHFLGVIMLSSRKWRRPYILTPNPGRPESKAEKGFAKEGFGKEGKGKRKSDKIPL